MHGIEHIHNLCFGILRIVIWGYRVGNAWSVTKAEMHGILFGILVNKGQRTDPLSFLPSSWQQAISSLNFNISLR
jgi:hypothetical protein